MTSGHHLLSLSRLGRLLPGLAGAVLLSACQLAGMEGSHQERNQRALAAELLRMEVRIGEEARSISNFSVTSFRAINDEALVVTSGLHEHYLITLAAPCLELPYAFAIGLQSQTSNVTSFDNIVVRSLHDRPEFCRIQRIYHLEDINNN